MIHKYFIINYTALWYAEWKNDRYTIVPLPSCEDMHEGTIYMIETLVNNNIFVLGSRKIPLSEKDIAKARLVGDFRFLLK